MFSCSGTNDYTEIFAQIKFHKKGSSRNNIAPVVGKGPSSSTAKGRFERPVTTFTVKVSYLEIYMEKVHDLLQAGSDPDTRLLRSLPVMMCTSLGLEAAPGIIQGLLAAPTTAVAGCRAALCLQFCVSLLLQMRVDTIPGSGVAGQRQKCPVCLFCDGRYNAGASCSGRDEHSEVILIGVLERPPSLARPSSILNRRSANSGLSQKISRCIALPACMSPAQVKEDPCKGFYVQGLREQQVGTVADVMHLLRQ